MVQTPCELFEATVKAAMPAVSGLSIEDLPEKWKQYAELNASYVQGGQFAAETFAKHISK